MNSRLDDEEDTFEGLGRFLAGVRGRKPQPGVANRLGVSPATVCRAEQGKLGVGTAERYDEVFGLGGAAAAWWERADRRRRRAERGDEPCAHGDLAALARAGGGIVVVAPAAEPPGGHTLSPPGAYRGAGDEEVTPTYRRGFLRVAATGALTPVAAALEPTRHGLIGSLAADRAAADVDEWQEIAWEYGISYPNTPPAELLRGLQIDLAALGDAFMRRPHADPAERELHKAAALLAAVAAHTVANLGDLRSSRRWWRTAKLAADESGHVETRLWIRGREIVRALAEQRPVPVILDLAEEAEAVSAGVQAPPAALPELLGGKARVFALAGQPARAEAALNEAWDNFARMPARIVGDTGSILCFSEYYMKFTESYVYSFLGDFARADGARAAARALAPASQLRGPTQLELHRALCQVRAGDVAPGVEHAHAVMTGLPRTQFIRPVVDLGHKVLDAVPAAERGRDGVRAFDAYLGEAA